MREKPIINERLLCAAGYVRQDARVCDVGTDHAYLPIFLCKAGIAERALACDVNEGPCERARKNVALNGCSDRIAVVRSDGLAAADGFDPTDIVICGMGGELIFRIVSESPLTRKSGVRLILQPMTKAPALRIALCAHGYRITDESVVRDDGKLYQVIVAEYSGQRSDISDLEALLGPVNMRDRKPIFREFVASHLKKQKAIRMSKLLHGVDHEREDELIALLERVENDS